MTTILTAALIDFIAPRHTRTSCGMPGAGNHFENEFGLPGCVRCKLLAHENESLVSVEALRLQLTAVSFDDAELLEANE